METASMLIEIDPTSTQPIFEQVVDQIKFAVAAGAIRANEMIPSVREMSRQLAINPNTIARAYRVLQDEGLVYTRRGMGIVVAEQAEEICQNQRKAIFTEKFRRFRAQAAQSGLSQAEIDEIIKNNGYMNT